MHKIITTSDFYEYQIAKLYAMKSSFQNQREARKWFELSAKKGNSFAMFSLANIYFYGNGIEQDMRKGKGCGVLEFLELASSL